MQVEHGVFFHSTAQFTQPRIFFKYWKYQSFVLINATLHSYIRYTITYNSFQTKYVLLKNNSRYTQPPSWIRGWLKGSRFVFDIETVNMDGSRNSRSLPSTPKITQTPQNTADFNHHCRLFDHHMKVKFCCIHHSELHFYFIQIIA